MSRLPCRPVYAQAAVLSVLALVGLSLVVDAPPVQAAPTLAGGLLALAVAGLLARAEPLTRPPTLALVFLFVIGGVGLWHDGLATLHVVERGPPLQWVTNVALLAGLGLFAVDDGPDAQ